MISLDAIIDAWSRLTILVIGDVMLDCYLNGSADRLCQEAPVPVVAVQQRQEFPGGAANVAANVASLGATVRLLSVIGEDWEGDRLRQVLRQKGIADENLIQSPNRETLAKQRVVANSHLLLRFDQGSTGAIDANLEQQVIQKLRSLFQTCDAVIVSDYGYGILTPGVIQALAELQQQVHRPIVVDAKQLTAYRSLQPTAVKPNYREAIHLLELPRQSEQRAEQLLPYGDRLLSWTGASIVAATLDSEGAIVFEQNQPPCRIASQPVPTNQTSGAGDTFVAALTLALAAQAPTRTAATLANAATSVVVQEMGTTLCSVEALQKTIAANPDPILNESTVCSDASSDRRLSRSTAL